MSCIIISYNIKIFFAAIIHYKTDALEGVIAGREFFCSNPVQYKDLRTESIEGQIALVVYPTFDIV